MSSSYPTSLDNLTDPTATSKTNSPAHSTQHININDAVEKLEAKVGVNSSAVTTTHDYKLSGVTGTDKSASKTGTETLENKTLTSPKINEDVAITAKATEINYLEGTTGTTGSGKLVLDTKPTFKGSVQTVTTDSDGATVTFDMSASNIHTVTLGGNRVLAVSNTTAGQYFAIELTQDGTGSRTVTWFSSCKWVGGTVPTLTTTPNKKDVFMFRCTGSGTYDAYIVGMAI